MSSNVRTKYQANHLPLYAIADFYFRTGEIERAIYFNHLAADRILANYQELKRLRAELLNLQVSDCRTELRRSLHLFVANKSSTYRK
jgi:hypothetical protein